MIKRLFFTVFAALTLGIFTVSAQDSTILTVGVPHYMSGEVYNSAFFDPFRAAHPGVDVVIISLDDNKLYPSPAAYSSVEEHLKGIAEYAVSADVLYMNPYSSASVEATAAGYWLDLAPLVAADPDLAENNFYPVAWRAFRWRNGMWALPSTVEPQLLAYDPKAFDEAGLTYPDEHWTIDNFAEAARALTKRDAQGNPTSPGCFCDINPLFYEAVNGSLTDENGNLNFDQPDLAMLLETWVPVLKETTPQGGYSSEGVGLQTTGLWILDANMRTPLVPAPPPQGLTSAYINGFGISAGTPNPELGFELVKYLIQNPLSYNPTTQFPALRSAVVGGLMPPAPLSADAQHIADIALENALAGSDFLYFDYLNAAMNDMRQNDTDVHAALQKAQDNAAANLETASHWTGAQTLVVNVPQPTPLPQSGEIILHFGISQYQVVNPSDWERIAKDFAADDPQVSQVELAYQGMDYQAFMDNNDCYYLTYNAVDPYRTADYVNLDPYTSADPNFIPDDFLPGTLETMELDGKIWGYPLNLYPAMLIYSGDTFRF